MQPFAYLSLIGEAIGTDDTLVVLNRSLGVPGLVLAPEVHIVQAKPLGIALVPFKLVQQRPGGVASHIDSIFNGYKSQRSMHLLQTNLTAPGIREALHFGE